MREIEISALVPANTTAGEEPLGAQKPNGAIRSSATQTAPRVSYIRLSKGREKKRTCTSATLPMARTWIWGVQLNCPGEMILMAHIRPLPISGDLTAREICTLGRLDYIVIVLQSTRSRWRYQFGTVLLSSPTRALTRTPHLKLGKI